ncbi:hypothetical protein Cri9333_3604 [Crinalium epipsammum PCC 9333]|uniref:Uncharacterized protein n=1 Tax=Crinalium epipsammum PCC 9333 TaxID=1173022 RepID=K9W2H3_9CYAN|nr:hypothetical protein [Crinalium epipsammum]AFZ14426.1 hypothetical protein Cri9333_3604 [Crinalium epipsammum PCC 9333]
MKLLPVQIAIQVCSILGMIVALGILIYAGGGLASLLSGFTIWLLLPYMVFSLMGIFANKRTEAIIILITSLVAFGWGTYFYIDAFFINTDPQSGLAFLFVPLYQLVLVILMGIISGLVRFIHTRFIS